MDDLIAELLEQVAFSGSIGVRIEDLWQFVDVHFQKLGEEQKIDSAYKNYLWSLLVDSSEIAVSVKAPKTSKNVPVTNTKTASLDELVTRHGGDLALCTTERQQWMTLTGHGVDHKEVA